jgi:myo-inositol-1(or 4)-monophosphatase
MRSVGVDVADTKSSPVDVVTEADRACEELIRERLLGDRPDDGFLGEEGDDIAGTSGIRWIVDPIDGTVNYLYRIPAYAVSVAVVTGDPTVPGAWSPLAGCVVAPALGELWTAGAGLGTRHASAGRGAPGLAGQGGPTGQGEVAWAEHPLQLSEPPPLASSLVGTGFGYSAQRRAGQAAVFARLLPRIRDIRRGGSAALDLCSVATGQLDAYYERGVNAWDIAAGWLIVTEAGGAVTGLDDGPPDRGFILAAAGPLHGALRAALISAGGADIV